MKSLQTYRLLLIFMTGLALLATAVVSFMIYRTIQRPVASLLQAIEHVEEGDFHYRILYVCDNELQDLVNGFNHMLNSLETLVEKVYKQEILTKRAQLKQLQAQIDPHFLFNSFFMLKTMLKCQRLEEADALVQHLGDYYEYVTRNDNDNTTLREEISHAQAYSQIQMMRFRRSFTVEFGPASDEMMRLPVPRMILQPFIENSVEHGVRRDGHVTNVHVRFEKRAERVVIRIDDTGGEPEDAKLEQMNELLDGSGSISAVVNIHRRLQIMYGTGSGLHFQKNGTVGMQVILTIDTEGGTLLPSPEGSGSRDA